MCGGTCLEDGRQDCKMRHKIPLRTVRSSSEYCLPSIFPPFGCGQARARVASHNLELDPLRNTVFYFTSDRHGKNTTKRDRRRCSRPTVITELYTQLRLLWKSARRFRANVARTKRVRLASPALGGRVWLATAHAAPHSRRTEDALEKPGHPLSPLESASTARLPKCTFPS